MPELLAALDRHRAAGREGPGSARARLARAEAQVWAILGERLRSSLVGPERRADTERLLEEVADHRLDPYAAADRLLATLGGPMATEDPTGNRSTRSTVRRP